MHKLMSILLRTISHHHSVHLLASKQAFFSVIVHVNVVQRLHRLDVMTVLCV